VSALVWQWLGYVLAMLEIRQIADRLGLTEHQVRRLLRALDTLLQGSIRRGRDNRILLPDSAVAILDRAVALWRGGIPLKDLRQALAEELQDQRDEGGKQPSGLALEQAKPMRDPCEGYRAMIAHLEEEVRWLRSQLEKLQQQALPPVGSRRRWPWSWLWLGKRVS